MSMVDGHSLEAVGAPERQAVLRRALVELKAARAELAAERRTRTEPVAVVGVGCRLPGGVVDADSFWDLLASGRSGIGEVPADRWDLGVYFDPDPDAPGRMYARHGGFLPDVRGFDAGLFGIPPREAVGMDPQHRLVLEVVWEALEHAGIAPDSLRGSRTGMFVGMGGSDYERLGLRSQAVIDGYAATGSAVNFAANRVSYALGLEGPSLVVDTACSSSLVALHLAVQALRAGECDLAIVAGVNLLLAPDTSVALSKSRMLSPTGQCHTFDASADGYVRGEGCGAVVLRRASAARDAGDDVLALVRGTAVNQDGRSSGITVPNAAAQRAVVRRALSVAGVAPGDVGYVEAHGTGTPLGDPIEVRALATVLGEGRERPLALGSVKTNIGHLEAAAGIAGLIKAILVARQGKIPPHLNLATPNPHVAWEDLPVHVPTELTDWPDERRVVGVSSFGFGGTNAHVVLENAPAAAPAEPAPEAAPQPVLVKLAAAGTPGLRALAARMADHAATLTPADLPGLAHAAAVGRADLTERAAVVADSLGELLDGLRAVADDRPHPAVATGRRVPGATVRVAFHAAPGGPPAALTDGIGDRSADLAEAPDDYARAVVLGRWWRSLGVEPDVLTAHGTGAYAAAALAGVLPVRDGARLAAAHAQGGAALADVLADVTLSPPAVDLVLDGAPAGTAVTTAAFWLDREAQPEPADPASDPAGVLIDLGPAAPPADPRRARLQAVARAWTGGVTVDWRAVTPVAARPAGLPRYPFQRKEHWFTTGPAAPTPTGAALDARIVETATGDVIAETALSLAALPFLDEHRVHGRIVVPGVVLLELVLRTAEQALGEPVSLADLTISRPLTLPDDGESRVQVVLTPATGEVRVHSRGEDGWPEQLRAKIVPGTADSADTDTAAYTRAASGCAQRLDHAAFYARAWHPAFVLGPSFRLVRDAARGGGAATARLDPPPAGCLGLTAGVRPDLLLLDACVQLVAVAAGADEPDWTRDPVHLGTGYERLTVHRPVPAGETHGTAVLRPGANGTVTGDVLLTDAEGPVAELRGVSFRPLTERMLARLTTPGPTRPAGPDVARLRALDDTERTRQVLAHLVTLMARGLGTTPDEVETTAPLTLYADSLMLAELRAAIERDLGVALPVATFFDDTDLADLAGLVAAELGVRAPAAPSTAAPAPAAPSRPAPPTRRPREMSVAEMTELAALDPEITASGPPAATAPAATLLTGGTGFVGAFLLAELLARHDGDVLCLVRADDEAHALRRITANLAHYGVDLGDAASRIVPLPGDLTKPRLGLTDTAFTDLHARVGSIHHCGAMVKWTYPYSGLAPANVEGTREILRLATVGAPRPVHHISTVGVFSSTEFTADVVHETDDLDTSGPLVVGYAQSKWVAERMVRTAHERGVPVTIHRVNTGGHSTTGAFNRLDHLSMLLKGCIEAGIAPDTLNMPVQPAPIDYVAAAVVALAAAPEHHGGTFHLVNDRLISWPELFDHVRDHGYPLAQVPFDEWRTRVTGRDSGTVALLGLAPFLHEAVDHVRLPVSDSAHTRAALAATDVRCPPLDAALVSTYLDRFAATGFVDPPALP
ncbi:thioester reductase domain-containing protein [Actinocorallia sp. API 0066]|uniref:thioester reductase domain-containing protein n=1 Tax=Actinocorallia sp. API 0066 TaxID=2896846 RepID=UPI001E397988|nr:thioester reductase domain-containing protein [Actinocorallia sp. API 0066]MCD0450493.1 thioester reductase domain-containing protein [Actinocorallia sp. API 0066]